MKWICNKCEKPCIIEIDEADTDHPSWCPWALDPTDESEWAKWEPRPIQVGDVTEHGKVKWIDPIGDGSDLVRIAYIGFKDDGGTPTITEDEFDPVNKPAHYTEGRKYEPIDVIEDWNLGFCLGNALKYISRAGRKDDIIQDLEKSVWYIERKIEQLKKVKE